MRLYRNIKPIFIDDRGGSTVLLDDGKTKIKSILLITCQKGAIRANHYHKKDSHYSYMLSGKMEYREKMATGKGIIKKAIIRTRDMVYTPPMAIHAMRFLEKSVFLAFATKSRKGNAYENDTVRIKLI